MLVPLVDCVCVLMVRRVYVVMCVRRYLRNSNELQHFLCSFHLLKQQSSVLLVDGLERFFHNDSSTRYTLRAALDAQDGGGECWCAGVAWRHEKVVAGQLDAHLAVSLIASQHYSAPTPPPCFLAPPCSSLTTLSLLLPRCVGSLSLSLSPLPRVRHLMDAVAPSFLGNVYQTLAFLYDTLLFMQTSTGFGHVVVTGASDSFILQRTTRHSLRRWCSFLAVREAAVGAADGVRGAESMSDEAASVFTLREETGEARAASERDGARDGSSSGSCRGVNRGDSGDFNGRDCDDSNDSDDGNSDDGDSEDGDATQVQIRFECYARSSKREFGGVRLLRVETIARRARRTRGPLASCGCATAESMASAMDGIATHVPGLKNAFEHSDAKLHS
ncbi:hypothetical protein PybrP1_003157 [[Pythium] brassicae (nom. inval.)]|nr:hypothetical protein PybrP1_003157 [[Pythium] brassicae (nom. inval.)]